MNLKLLTDEELAVKAQETGPGSEPEAILVDRYTKVAGHTCDEFNVQGTDREDKHMVCLHGLIKAIRNYEDGRGSKFKNYAKFVMRNDMTSLQREANRAKEIPRRKLRSLDEPINSEDGEVGLIDAIQGDGEAQVLGGLMAEAIASETRAAQWSAFESALNGMDEGVRVRMIDGVLELARIMGHETYADIRDLVKSDRDQAALFSAGPERGTHEARELGARVFEVYAAVMLEALDGEVGGFSPAEIAAMATDTVADVWPGLVITESLVRMMINATRADARVAA